MSALANVSFLFLVTFIHQSSGSCVRHGMDFWGADLWNFSPSTFDSCTNLCKAATSCKAITYQPSSKTCWLKYRRGGNHGPSLVPGLISANMNCEYKRDQSCAKHSVDYGGADLGHRTATTLDQCEQFCRDTERCVSLTFRASSRSCWLKHRKSGARGPSTVHGLVSLNMECPPSGTQTSGCVHNDIDFWGADLINLRTDRYSVSKCEGFCREEPRCVSFTYRSSDGQCWLKGQQYGARGPSHAMGLISMNMNCSK